ncbi:MAG TPA: hypothetical protein VGG84_09905 [Gemmatimonadaceae bacterium]
MFRTLEGAGMARRLADSTSVRRHIVSGALTVLAALSFGHRVEAQSIGDLAAWDALMVTPAGALPPRAHDLLFGDSPRTELSFQYGRWRYDVDDAIHNDFGVTVTRALSVARTSISLTAAYLSLSCGTCAAWVSGGLEARTQLITRRLTGDSSRDVRVSAGVVASGGAARFLGEGHATAGSIAGAASLGVAFPVSSSRVSLTVLPGVGIGRFSSVDQDAYGTRPMLGASAACVLPWGMVADLGIQRVYIDGGPTQVGLGLTWRTR